MERYKRHVDVHALSDRIKQALQQFDRDHVLSRIEASDGFG